MAKKDYGWRQPKKAKKTEKKEIHPVLPQSLPEVEVVPKGKKKKEELEEEA